MDGPTANATGAARALGFNLESPARLERDRFRTIGTFTDDEMVQRPLR